MEEAAGTPGRRLIDEAAGLAPLPTAPDRKRWTAADRRARPGRLARLRERLAAQGVDGYFGVRAEHSRYLTGFRLGDGEDRVAGSSGWFIVRPDDVLLLTDSRYTLQAQAECAEAAVTFCYGDLADRWAGFVAGLGRVAVEAGFVGHALWERLAEAAPDTTLVPVEGWLEEDRQVKEPAETERIAAACAVADTALTGLLPRIAPGVTEYELALELEWAIRTGGGDGLAFDVACLAGPQAALPHGSPRHVPVEAGQVLLFDFGAQVDGYRSDMTRTLFVGQPRTEDLALYELVARAQEAAFDGLEASLAGGEGGDPGERPTGKHLDALARAVIVDGGHGDAFGHALGHGIGLATHELPTLSSRAPEAPLPGPTVFSVEPGVYLAGRTGVRIEDLVRYDPAAGELERLTRFPRAVTVVGA
ncbi:MAG TPA: Xaa-Pro peptidase family protein [Candidatus Limnocylindrales bacterium]|nr:Xaa-Pro peptidase family protein [Candidatus Limnocylindrales bacterium]